ncbi:AAA family ATPase [Microbacterium thalassium]|uniref:Nuclease SbcCD subunit C n=1 Tax=Microbacterium thalassium TaxID=362649 RepID=A0A7X0FSP0_9MICO|nr:SMC family ATPase [Microbacterium thalassium]MBB6393005.1 exonuclease SbcC [Microbacterium thalassium]GLK22764.1 nuclease SbcCD subunit C [Microbacterium thalassium]
MRLHRLTLEGFGPFRSRQEVDFDAFADDGIFLIAGRTGAGKSSVLDGVCFALYGGVPRYDGSEKRLRSDHCTPDEPTEVSVEFTTGGRRWRVTRSPEYDRAKRRGTGTTTVAAEAQLDERVDGVWIGRASGARAVGLELDDVLGLNQQQFLQVILLAQNRFAQFLLARSDERQKLLRRLFGTRTYEDYQSALDERRRESERSLEAAGEGVALLLDEVERALGADGLGAPQEVAEADEAAADAPTRLAAARVGAQRAAYRAETLARERDHADAAHRTADDAHAKAKELHERQLRRIRSRETLDALESRAEDIERDRIVFARAGAAEVLRAPIEAAERADADVRAAIRRVDRAREDFALLDDEPVADPDDVETLRSRVDELTGHLALWTSMLDREKDLARLQNDIDATARSIAEHETGLAAIAAAVAEVPAKRDTLDERLTAARAAAVAGEGLIAQRDDLTARREAARQAAALAARTQAAEAAYLEASTRHDAARSAVTELLRRRLAGFAGELAENLADGEPCPVCGAAEHPHPAVRSDDAVGDDEVAAAEAARDAAAAAEQTAGDSARSAREEHATARARAGDLSEGELAERLAAVVQAVEDADSAARTVERLTAERAELVALEATARDERERVMDELQRLRESLAVSTARAERDRRAVDEARGPFATVADRIADAERRRAASLALADAVAARIAAEGAALAAARDRDARIADTDFADAAAATAALRDAAARAALDQGIREYEAAVRAERDRLRELELELAGESDAPIDLTATREALAAARDAWSSAVDAAAHATQVAGTVAGLVARADRAHEKVGALAEDAAIIARLANTVAGRAPNTHRMTLESFVLAAELEEIVEAANVRLSDMSAGRYSLQHTDALAARGAASGLGLEIMDAHTGHARPAQSLSGGETFLASLALALGLAEVVTARAGGVRLDTLFIDEGFGSLDEDTLDLAMRTLDELRAGGRTVGLISHVAAMKEQLPAQLLVEATPEGPSVIRHDAPAYV